MGDVTPELRFAIFTTWPERCVWCTRPITFREMEVDHLIPQYLDGPELLEALRLHGLASTYDLHAEENLAPSCRGCNGDKGKRVPPDAPVISMLLNRAAERAAEVRKRAAATLGRSKMEKLIAQLHRLDLTDAEVVQALRLSIDEFQVVLAAAPLTATTVSLTPTASLELGDDGMWAITGFGDCPNENCYTGDLSWRDVATDRGELTRAATCYVCGTEAVQCPDCGSVNSLFIDSVSCSGCENTLDVIRDRDAGDVEEVVVSVD